MRQKPLGPVGDTVHRRIQVLQRGYLDDQGWAVAALARLRRGAGRPSGEDPDLWGLIGTESLYDVYAQPGVAEEAMLRVEEAAHAAITLWSVHQQSHHISRMHRRPGPELGAAVRRLTPGAGIDEPTRRRFVRAGTATTPVVLAGRLRELVTLMRREAVPLDYGLLADQLHTWQSPGGPEAVRRSWGRSYLIVPKPVPEAQPQAEDMNSSEDETP
ncbi:type I-E CRISPR-associated protein Cse2/CasB [Streptomyces albidoflavus]